jgi:hypothetical protein
MFHQSLQPCFTPVSLFHAMAGIETQFPFIEQFDDIIIAMPFSEGDR